ncbi:MAG TPA: glycosyltransferase family 4 protein [Rhodocyclaceae bacterium]|jgi:UDP-glucose:(heptosyl)LPS alpha-1,3-glucosyltransferase|nr:glycosyltransferase family 4 protein [Rhodocyclaceae bacterium]
MKLAIVRQKYTPFGGAERFVERALSALADKGLDVTIITRQWKGDRQDGRKLRLCNPFYLGRLWRDASFSREVQKIVAEGEFDLVQSHERIPGCHIYRAGDGVHATWLELRARTQSALAAFFTRWHPWHRYVLRAEARMFRDPALKAVICNSRMVKDDIVRRFGVAEDKLHVIHNGVDLEYFHPGLREQYRQVVREQLGIPQTASMVLFVGSGFERKGVFPLLKAVAGLPDVHLVVVGKDRKLSAAQKLVRQLGIAERTYFLGAQQDVRPYYGAADVFALPTLYDPFPNAVLEALACGLPVLTSPTSGAAELVGEHSGKVVDALDVIGQQNALKWLLSESPQAVKGARQVAQQCGAADMAGRLLALYSRLMGSAAPV